MRSVSLSRRASTAFALVAAVTLVASCQPPPEVVARLSAEPTTLELPFPQTAAVTLRWTPLIASSELEGQPLAFVHLLNANGDLMRTFDHPLDLARWTVGQELEDRVDLDHSFLAPRLPPGDYRLTAGLYEPGFGRFALETNDVDSSASSSLEYTMATVVVPEPAPGYPIELTGDWRPLEDTGDLQVVVSRWLGARGEIVLTAVDQPHVLRLRLRIPSDIPGSELTFPERESASSDSAADDEEAPLLAISSTCGNGFETDEIGSHRVELSIDPGTTPAECRVTLAASAHWLGPQGNKRSASLDSLTLTPVTATVPP